MGYASAADVERLDAALSFTPNSLPSRDDVTLMCEDVSAEIDGILAAQNYTVPVPTTATVSFRLLRRFTALCANALAQRAAPDSPNAEAAEKACADCMKRLEDAKVVLPDATRDLTRSSMRVSDVGTSFFFRDMAL
jgi:hypothetical protein